MEASVGKGGAPLRAGSLDGMVDALSEAVDREEASRFERAVVRTFVRVVDDAAVARAATGAPLPDGPSAWGAALAAVRETWVAAVATFDVVREGAWTATVVLDDAAPPTTQAVSMRLRLPAAPPPDPIPDMPRVELHAPSHAQRRERIRWALVGRSMPADEPDVAAVLPALPPPHVPTLVPVRTVAARPRGEIRRFDVVVGTDRRIWVAVDDVGFAPDEPVRLVVVPGAVSFVQGSTVFGTVTGCADRSVDLLTSRAGGTVDLVEIPTDRTVGRPVHHTAEVDAVSVDAPMGIRTKGRDRVADPEGLLRVLGARGENGRKELAGDAT